MKMRDYILCDEQNIIVLSGNTNLRTQLIIDRFEFEFETSKNRTHYKFAVLLVDNKAVNDIKKRLKNIHENFIGTNDSFVESEIIIPFINDTGLNPDDFSNDFELALEILKDSLVSRQYIISKYKRIFIDNYQDLDEDMTNFFMYLKNSLKIKFFITSAYKYYRLSEYDDFNDYHRE